MLTDPRIESYREISFACPEQYDGKLTTGENFYFRYRNGYASLYLSWSINPRGPEGADAHTGIGVGGNFQGIFEDSEQRNGVFKLLLDELDAPAGFDRETYGVSPLS